MSNTTIYAQTLLILVAVAAAAHFLTGLDWPWAVVAGAVVSVVARTLTHVHRAG